MTSKAAFRGWSRAGRRGLPGRLAPPPPDDVRSPRAFITSDFLRFGLLYVHGHISAPRPLP
ncbi:hypothetical protein GCM10012278_37440 [Nonomuraea glycinis]|uniref:Uncharacterized protein n=1 Tax=Nonomuraea glycinis TaxID=2047744 RepID=A0A918A5D6_9ACTN|nr:hypothetical protein GCM10012278_37440 [Nonomuraea glycinis]